MGRTSETCALVRPAHAPLILLTLWISYTVNRRLYREGTKTTSITVARKLRARRLVEMGRGEPGKAAEKILVGELLDAYEVNAKLNGYSSVRTSRGHLKRLRSTFGHWRAVDLTTDVIEHHQLLWREAGLSDGTINRVCNTLRRAFMLARRARKIYLIPFIPRLAESGRRGKYIGAGDFEAVLKGAPAFLGPFLRFACAHGTRKGQLARAQRRFVDLERGVSVWPPIECKHRESHVVPLEGEALAIVRELMEAPPLWCPYPLPRAALRARPDAVQGLRLRRRHQECEAAPRPKLRATRLATCSGTMTSATSEALRERLATCPRAEARSAHHVGDADPGSGVIFLDSGYTARPCSGTFTRVSARSSAPEPLAQLAEQQPFKLRVVGSIPTRLIHDVGGASRRRVADLLVRSDLRAPPEANAH